MATKGERPEPRKGLKRKVAEVRPPRSTQDLARALSIRPPS